MIAALDQAEERAVRAWHSALDARGSSSFEWRLERVGDLLCSVSPSEPSILLNRVLGWGAGSEPTPEQLHEVRRLYREAGVSRFFLHVMPGGEPARREELLAAAGYRRYRGWMKFRRGPGDIPAGRETTLEVRQVGPESAVDFAAIVAPAFDLSPAGQKALEVIAGADGWRLYMSFDGATPVGTGGLFMADGVAYLDWGATRREFRGRGSQGALLRRRVTDALAEGCETLTTMTGEAVPGDPQHSYGNIMKLGFEEYCLRENWIPEE